jgi:hypothetical protein
MIRVRPELSSSPESLEQNVDRVSQRNVGHQAQHKIGSPRTERPGSQVDTVAGSMRSRPSSAARTESIWASTSLVLAVLPHPEDNAKDFGVFTIANAGPSSLAPLLGAALLAASAGKNYDLLYITAAAVTFLGAPAIVPVTKVKS